MSTPIGEAGGKSAVRNILGLSFMPFAGAYCLAAAAGEATQAANYVFNSGTVHQVAPSQIGATKVDLTMTNGKIAYRAQ